MTARQAPRWSRLDNAGKLFASVSDRADPKVMRFSCELTELVDGPLLQQALDENLAHFPTFRSTLRKGLFWYFLEDSDLSPVVEEEHLQPCSPLYDRIRQGLLFSVTYYKKRINVEVYHALSDGTGVLQFLRMLTYHYLVLRHPEEFGAQPPVMDFDASASEQADDSFRRYYEGRKPQKAYLGRAFRMRGPKLSDHRMHILSGVAPTSAVIAEAKKRGATLTAFLSAVMMFAFYGEMRLRDRKKPVVITVPVNLRNYFESESVRNFFGIFNVGHVFTENDTLDSVVEDVARHFREELTAEKLKVRMNNLSAIEHNPIARIVPLAIKDRGIWLGSWVSDLGVSAALSNIGRVSMPEEFSPYLRLFDVFISTQKVQLCMCSYGENLTLSITAPFLSTNLQKRFFRTLTSLGIPVTINSNIVEAAATDRPPDLPDPEDARRERRMEERKRGKQQKDAPRRKKTEKGGAPDAKL